MYDHCQDIALQNIGFQWKDLWRVSNNPKSVSFDLKLDILSARTA